MRRKNYFGYQFNRLKMEGYLLSNAGASVPRDKNKEEKPLRKRSVTRSFRTEDLIHKKNEK